MNATNFEKLSDAENEHFYRCSNRDELVDKRELLDVIFHETDHKPKHSENHRKPIRKRPS